jgi:hypothetical protein
MAFYTDPLTGQRTEVDEPMVREPSGAGISLVGWIVLLAVLVGGAMTFFNYYGYPITDRLTSTIVNPVTTPSDPNTNVVRPSAAP